MNNPLTNILTPRVRGLLYAALFLAALIFSAYQAADGDWAQFVGGLITSLLSATAASNASLTPTADEPTDDDESDYDKQSEDETYVIDPPVANPGRVTSQDLEVGYPATDSTAGGSGSRSRVVYDRQKHEYRKPEGQDVVALDDLPEEH